MNHSSIICTVQQAISNLISFPDPDLTTCRQFLDPFKLITDRHHLINNQKKEVSRTGPEQPVAVMSKRNDRARERILKERQKNNGGPMGGLAAA